MTASLLPAVLVAVAAALLLAPTSRLGGRDVVRARPAVLLVTAAVGVTLVRGHAAVLALVVAASVLGARRLWLAQRTARARALASARVGEVCEAIAAELVAGRPPPSALRELVADFPELAPVAAAAELGADVPSALRDLADHPGRHDLRLVAAAWQVAARSGAGLADPLERVAAVVRERRRTARLVAGELAAAHATARIMAVLPVVFLLAASGLGGDPWGFLGATRAGLVCLTLGLLLTYLGLAWLQRIGDRVEADPA